MARDNRPLTKERHKGKPVVLWLHADKHDDWQAIARARGEPLSVWLRTAGQQRADRTTKRDEAAKP